MIDSLLGVLYAEIKCIRESFISCSINHVYREGNKAAHLLARNAWLVKNTRMWWDCIPEFISQVIWLD